jgi:hypothetical protein
MEEEKQGLRKFPEIGSKALFQIVNKSYEKHGIALSHETTRNINDSISIRTIKSFNKGEIIYSLQLFPVIAKPQLYMITKHLSEFYDIESSIFQYLVHSSDDPSMQISNDGLSLIARKDLPFGSVLSFNFNSTELEISRHILSSSSMSSSISNSPRGFRSLSLDEMKNLLLVKQINCSRLIINYFKRCLLEYKLNTHQPLHLLAISPNYAAYAYCSVDLHCSTDEGVSPAGTTSSSVAVTTTESSASISSLSSSTSATFPSSSCLPLLTSESRLLTNDNVEDLLTEVSSLSSPYDCIINLCDGYQYDANDPGLNMLHRMENYAIPFTGSNSRVYTLTKADIRESGYSPKFITYAEYEEILRLSVSPGESNRRRENSDDMLSVDQETALKVFFQTKNLTFPLFIKPNSLGGSLYIDNDCLVHNHASLYFKLKQLLKSSFPYNDFLIQEYIEGDEYTCLTFRNRDGNIVSFQPIKVTFPNSEYAFKSDQLKNIDYHLIGMEEEENKEVIKEIQEVCKDVYETLKLNAYIRYDIRYRSTPDFASREEAEREEKEAKTIEKNPTRKSKGRAYIIDINSYPGIFGIVGEECSTDLIIQKQYSYPRFLYDMIYNTLYDPFNYYNTFSSCLPIEESIYSKVVSLSPSTTAISLSTKVTEEDQLSEVVVSLSSLYYNREKVMMINNTESTYEEVASSLTLTTFKQKRKIFLLNYQRISPKTILLLFSSCFFTILENLYNLESITIDDLMKNPSYISFVYFWPSYSYYYSPCFTGDEILVSESNWKDSSSIIDLLEFYHIHHNGLIPSYRPFFLSNNSQMLQCFFSSHGIKFKKENEISCLDDGYNLLEVISVVFLNHQPILKYKRSFEDYCNRKKSESGHSCSAVDSWVLINDSLSNIERISVALKGFFPNYHDIYQVDFLIRGKECDQVELEVLNICIPSVSVLLHFQQSQLMMYTSFLI